MKITTNQLRRIIKEETSKVLKESYDSASDPRVADEVKKFVDAVRSIDPSVNFGDLEGALAKAFRRPSKPLSPEARAAATAKAAKTRAASKEADARGAAYQEMIKKNREKLMSALEQKGITRGDYSDAEMSVFGGGSHDASQFDVLVKLLGSKARAKSMLDSLGLSEVYI